MRSYLKFVFFEEKLIKNVGFASFMAKVLLTKQGNWFFVKDEKKDYHTDKGIVKAADLKRKSGTTIKTSKGIEMIVIKPTFIDDFKKIKRGSQIMVPRDIAAIIAETGINKDSKVLDAGSGSGGLACFLAKIVKQVITYEIKEESYDITKQNIKTLGLNNVKQRKKDVYRDITERNLDLIVLDVREPWNAINNASKALKSGAFLVAYCPQITQSVEFVNKMIKSKDFIHLRTKEINEREWNINGRVARPQQSKISFTGFLTFCRKI